MAKKSNYNKKRNLIGKSYVNGIKNEDGEQVIRPLNESEIEFLNKFNEEFVNRNFQKDETDVHYPLIQQNKKEVRKLKRKLGKVNNELTDDSSGWRKMNSEEREAFSIRKRELHLQKNELKAKLIEIDVIGTAIKNDYSRGVDVSNYPKRTVNISDLEPANFIYTGEERSIDTDSETSLFERLKVLNDV